MMNKANKADTIELGKVVGVWGVKGWLKVFSYTRNREDIGQYAEWLLMPVNARPLSSDCQSYAVKNCRVQGQSVVAQLEGVDDRDAAQALIGQKVFITTKQLPALPAGEYYWFELIGLDVVNAEGEALGVVTNMMETGANDVFVIKQEVEPELEQQASLQPIERLIPHIDEVVLEVDLEKNLLRVDWGADFLVTD